MPIRALGFDADDTLWHNERHYQDTQAWFAEMLAPFAEPGVIGERLYAAERNNLRFYGYGVKGFMLSLIETGLDLTDGRLPAAHIRQILERGKAMLGRTVELIDGVRDTLVELSTRYDLILITKGDLFHQETLVAGSGIGELFRSVEVVSEKDQATYSRVLRRNGVEPADFVMVGNSLRSDVLPVVALGGRGIHIPHPLMWQHELTDERSGHGTAWWELSSITELPARLAELETS